MPLREPKASTVKRLFALSCNQCAFPECRTPIIETSGVITGIICHIRARSKGGPRYDPKQTAEQRHSFENLILLCSRHSKIIDSQPEKYPVELLVEIKEIHERRGNIEISPQDVLNASRLLENYRLLYVASGSSVSVHTAETIHAKTVRVERGAKSPKFKAPDGSVGSSLAHRNYAKHLIDRYHEFASKQPGRQNFRYPAIYAVLKKEFRAKWDMIPITRFSDFTTFLQKRIDRTKLGRINKAKGYPNYSDFEEYQKKYGQNKG